MCGIFGLYNEPNLSLQVLAAKLIQGLNLLEYRGYDSAGMLIQSTTGDSIICKSEGNVQKLKNKAQEELANSNENAIFNIGTAHTRWATHGKPSNINSHPHTSDTDYTFSVVHNGIITNYKELRTLLENNGFIFESQTDTEVIPKLCMFVYKQKPTLAFVDVVFNVIDMLQGSFALLITSRIFPSEIVAYKFGSPLIIGQLTKQSLYFSSDIAALLDCPEIYVMKDREMFHKKTNSHMLYNYELINCLLSWEKNTIMKEEVCKGDHDTFMKKEISEQPSVITKAIAKYVENDTSFPSQINIKFPTIAEFRDKIKRSQCMVLIACGTSLNSCLASRWIMSECSQKHVYVEVAGQFVEVGQKTSSNFVYIFVSQSGETAETVEALRYVKDRCPSALCIAITNKSGSTLAREATCYIDIHAGLEISVASTKAYTSQMMVLSLLSVYLKDKPIIQQIINYQPCYLLVSLLRIPDLIKHTLFTTEQKIQSMVSTLLKYRSFLFVGRGADYATALEAALKVKEVSYVHSEGVMASELKHGPLAMIDENVCIFVFATQNKFYKKMISVIEQLKARNASVYVICNEGDSTIYNLIKDDSHIINLPFCDADIQHIINIIPMQLLAFYLAIAKGNQVDQPRNLAKSVTVSD